MNEEERFEAVLRELSLLLDALGDLKQRAVLIGGQVLALESKRRGGTGVILVRTDSGIEVARGFTMEPDLLFDLDENTFGSERLTEVLYQRGYRRHGREFRWVKQLPGGGAGVTMELDLFAPQGVEKEMLPTPMTPLPDAELVLKHSDRLMVRVGEHRLEVQVPDPVAFLALKLRAKREHRPTASKDCFDLYAYVRLVGADQVGQRLREAGRVGERIRNELLALYGHTSSPGVLDVLDYAGQLGSDESGLLAQDVVDVFSDVAGC